MKIEQAQHNDQQTIFEESTCYYCNSYAQFKFQNIMKIITVCFQQFFINLLQASLNYSVNNNMSTFQKFRKSKQSNKSQSRTSQKQELKNQSQYFNLSFNINQILFCYSEGKNIIFNSDLVVTNLSNQNIYFKIRSNNPLYYQIIPQQDIIHPTSNSKIVFKLKIDKILNNTRDKYPDIYTTIQTITQGNLFEFQWAVITEEQLKHNSIPALKYAQTLKIKVQRSTMIESKNKSQNQKQMKGSNFSRENFSSGIKGSSKNRLNQGHMWGSNSLQILNGVSKNFIQNKSGSKHLFAQMKKTGSRVMMTDSNNLQQTHASLLRPQIIIAVVVISFLIGFISA